MIYHFNKTIAGFIIAAGLVIIIGSQAQGQIITTIAGNGTASYSGDNGPATLAELYNPDAACVDDSGNVYIADQSNCRIRKINASTGVITTVAGDGTPGFSGDGLAATNAELNGPAGVVVDSAGNLYIGDDNNGRIRKVTKSTGIISTIAGGGSNAGTDGVGDGGQATDASLDAPLNLALDDSGNIYIADHYHERVRKITVSTGIITDIAGNGTLGYSGNGGQATAAELYYPEATAMDDSGNVYIADQWNNVVRKVTVKTGIITNAAGNGNSGYSGDGGQATDAELDIVSGVAVDGSGNIYIADERNNVIREVTKSTGIINTIAGDGFDQGTWNGGFSGDGGSAIAAELNQPYGITVDACGNVYIGDQENNRIRKVTVVSDTIKVFPVAPSLCSGSSDTLTASGAGTYSWTPSTGLSASTGSVVIANPTITTTYIITGTGACTGAALPDTVVVKVTPAPPMTILPQDTSFCSGQSAALHVSNGGLNFMWYPSTGLSVDTGAFVVASPTVTTNYIVTGINSGGCADTGTDLVTIIPSPNKPTFTQVGDTLTSSSVHDNQWYRNDTLLKNDTSQNLTITIPGEYWVVVNNEANGCSTSSDSANVKLAGINQLSIISDQLSIYPNPFNNNVFIKINSLADIKNWNLQITDVLGRTIFSKLSLDYNNDIDLSNLASGVYFITVINKTGKVVMSVVKQD